MLASMLASGVHFHWEMDMVTKEQVEEAYREMEYQKSLIPIGNGLGCRGSSYSTSIYEDFALAALIFEHVAFGWECENPAQGKRYWTFTVPEGLLCMSEAA
jgi:hypothetical protein